ncbi:guanylate kinase [Lachnospiraceae bacterium 62-35]
MKKKGILVVVSGFSGAGKGTVIKALMEKYDNYALSVSATTRSPRKGEENGREYFFISEEEFQKKISEHALIEYAQYVNHYYGTPKDYVTGRMDEGIDVILEIEIQGAIKVKEQYPSALLLFLMPPSAEELKKRLMGRGTESEEVIDARLRRASDEAAGMEQYDYILINDRVEDCVEEMHRLIQSQHHRMSLNLDMIRQMREELKSL